MEYQEFKIWLEKKAQGYEAFITKANDSKIEKNKNRNGKTKKWTKKQIENQVNEMWEQFLEEMEFLDSFNNSMYDLEIE